MDIFLLLPSCGWCVNQFYFIILLSFPLFFNFSGCGFKISFSFSWVASLGIRVILPLVINTPSGPKYLLHFGCHKKSS